MTCPATPSRTFLDIKLSDLLVLLTESASALVGGTATSGGRHVETGFALALGKPVIVVGAPENVFHRLRAKPGVHGWSVQCVADWHEAVLVLAGRLVEHERAAAREVSR